MNDQLIEQHVPVLFKGEYERELERWFRTRFKVLCVLFAVFQVLTFGAFVLTSKFAEGLKKAIEGGSDRPLGISKSRAALIVQDVPALSTPAALVGMLLALGIVGVFLLIRGRRVETRLALVHEASWMIVLVGAVHLVMETITAALSPSDTFSPFTNIFLLHFSACLILPWSPRESLKPMLPLVAAYLIADFALHPAGGKELYIQGAIPQVLLVALAILLRIVVLPLILLPGCLICWWRLRRHARRFGRRMASQGFMELRNELAQARRIHESLFPRPARREDIEFDLFYRPMREVGGDFIQAWTDPLDRFHMVVIDVTGHGLAAAMTVNRLAGELDRIRAENPMISPSSVLAGLNRYIHLTLAKHVIFGTAVSAQLDPHTGRLTIANAGHPAAIIRRRDGRVETRESSAFLLGAMSHTEFEVTEEILTMAPGDLLFLVTDGLVEARDRRGRAFGEGRLREACGRQPPPERWASYLAELVENWSAGLLWDDLLVATLALSPQARPVSRSTASPKGAAAGSGAPAAAGAAAGSAAATVPGPAAP